MAERVLLRAEEVGHILGIGRWKVYELMTTGDLPAVRIGRLVRVPRSALDQWIRDRTTARQGA